MSQMSENKGWSYADIQAYAEEVRVKLEEVECKILEAEVTPDAPGQLDLWIRADVDYDRIPGDLVLGAIEGVWGGLCAAHGSDGRFRTGRLLLPFHSAEEHFTRRVNVYITGREGRWRPHTPLPWPKHKPAITSSRGGMFKKINGPHNGDLVVGLSETDYQHARKAVHATDGLDIPDDFPSGGMMDMVVCFRALLTRAKSRSVQADADLIAAAEAIVDRFPAATQSALLRRIAERNKPENRHADGQKR
jgi:hypothetical protein